MHPISTARSKLFGGASRALIFLLLLPIRLYQYAISPLLGHNCRFMPPCSQYAKEAIQTHGACTGAWLALKRVARCHPLGGSGFDPVPEKQATSACHSNHSHHPNCDKAN